MSLRLHKFVLALCVTLCLAVALWPRSPGPTRESRAEDTTSEGAELLADEGAVVRRDDD